MEMTFGDPDGFLCVYVGRVSSEKRIEIIFAAVRALKGNRAAYLAIVGDGPLAGFWSKRHGKENRIYCRPQFFDHAQLAEVLFVVLLNNCKPCNPLDICFERSSCFRL